MVLFTEPPSGLVDEAEFVIVNPHRANRAFAKIENFMTRRRPFACDGGHLVVAIQMVLVRPVTDRFAFQQFFSDVRIACAS